MTQYVRFADGISPSNFSVNFRDVSSEPGPMWMTFDYWIHTADPAATGGVIGSVSWTDPTGGTVVEDGTGIASNDATGHNQNRKVFNILCQDSESPWTFDMQTFGDVGTSLISYILMLQKEPMQVDW